MTTPTESYAKVFYDLRPAKQIERRMILDAFLAIAELGIPIRDYQYTGMGSIHFVDFLLFHRWLGVTKLLSVEFDMRIEKRVKFNRPFSCVDIEMAPVGDVIPQLAHGLHILWLDYDDRLSAGMLQDVVLASQRLPVGSLLLVTVDVTAPDGDGPAEWQKYFEREGGDYVPFDTGLDQFAGTELAHTNSQILLNAIRHGITGRTDVEYLPLFSFSYADGHTMLTVGGMFGGPVEREKIGRLESAGLPFLRRHTDARPYEIDVPVLTRRERLYLDQYMPSREGWTPDKFELTADDVARYRKVYRYYPMYGELLF